LVLKTWERTVINALKDNARQCKSIKIRCKLHNSVFTIS